MTFPYIFILIKYTQPLLKPLVKPLVKLLVEAAIGKEEKLGREDIKTTKYYLFYFKETNKKGLMKFLIKVKNKLNYFN